MKKQIAALIMIVSATFATSAHADMKDYNRCSDAELASGVCILKMSAMTTTLINIKIADGKQVMFAANPQCGRDVLVRDPNNYELDLRDATVFKEAGTYTISNNGMNCEVQVIITAPQGTQMRPMAGVSDNLTSLLTILNAFRNN